jgi:hypothetical protein
MRRIARFTARCEAKLLRTILSRYQVGSPIGELSGSTRVAFRDPATQIRLLRLDPDSTDDDISATLDVWDKDSAPPYYAVSYVCGTSPARNAIEVNGLMVQVRDNCFEALQQTILHFPGSYVWIDALCINQDDLAEKSAQVTIMGEIYVKASLVLACIGPTDPFIESILALDGLPITRKWAAHEARQIDRSTMKWMWYPDGLTHPETRFPTTAQDEIIVKNLIAEWNELSLRPYFKRAWIVRELAGGVRRTVVLCGQDMLDWTLMLDIAGRLEVVNYDTLTNMPIRDYELEIFTLDEIVNQIGAGGRYTEIAQYLKATSRFRCGDPRDRVFSVLSLVDWTGLGQSRLLPDYNMTLSQLAYQLMCRMVTLNFSYVSDIVQALNLDGEYSDAMHSELLAPYRRNGQSGVREQWSQTVDGAFVVKQDTAGRFHVDLKTSPARHKDFSSWLPNCNEGSLRVKGLVAVFAEGQAFALACESMQEGDILLIGDIFDLVLRACSDASRFVVVGAAFAPLHFSSWLSRTKSTSDSKKCECWQADANDYDGRPVTISLEVSREEAFTGIWARSALEKGLNENGVVSYMLHSAIGTVRRGAYVRDITTCDWEDQQFMGPSRPLCRTHLSSERYRASRNALWCTIVLGSGKYVRRRRLPRSRTSSMSSSEGCTEEE